MKEPRPNRYRSRWAGRLRADQVGESVRVAGWVHRRRDHGGLIFIDLRDRTGLLQLVFRPEEAPEAHEAAGRLRAEDVISAEGELVRREEGTVNPGLPTGEVELAVDGFDLLASSETPPFQIDEDEPVGEELRLRYRYLDLRKQLMSDMVALRHDVVKAIRDHLSDEGFLEIETPILTRSTPEGARDFLVPSRLTRGSWYALPQSPQLFKQLLIMGGVERYFQIPRCFRDEDFRADRQPEFTQLDVEMGFVEEEDVIDTIDRLMKRVLAVGGIEIELPLQRLTYDEAMLRYGSDRPDRRLGVEIVDVSDALRGSEFKVFSGAIEAGGVVRALKAGGEWPRSRFDALTEKAQQFGAKGLAWAVVEDGGWRSPIAKFLSEQEIAGVTEALGAHEGDAILIVADRAEIAARVLGVLRADVAESKPAGHDVFWVVDFPMFEWNEDEKRFDAMHHPFTAPTGDLDADPGTWRSRAYDVIFDGWELGGGSIRINTPEVQQKVFDALGIDAAEAKERFGFLLEALRYGAPPHGGIAFGIDRWVALLAGRDSIRDAIAFPKTASGADPLTGAPAPVDERQLRELGLRLA
ncbi:MAG TPA: aspartate--tRNA ligase [Thermoleophilaceae bacterium]